MYSGFANQLVTNRGRKGRLRSIIVFTFIMILADFTKKGVNGAYTRSLMLLNTNLNVYPPQRSLVESTQAAAVAMERLSTGLKINSAKDDVAGFAIAKSIHIKL